MKYEAFKEKLLKDNPALRKEYEKVDIEFELAETIIDFRVKHQLSQKGLARQTGLGIRIIKMLEETSF
jgi:hypothetical protein